MSSLFLAAVYFVCVDIHVVFVQCCYRNIKRINEEGIYGSAKTFILKLCPATHTVRSIMGMGLLNKIPLCRILRASVSRKRV